MNDPRTQVIEDQLDTLSQKVESLMARVDAMVDILSDSKVAAAMCLDADQRSRLNLAFGPMAQFVRHRMERETRVQTLERDAKIDALLGEASSRKAGGLP